MPMTDATVLALDAGTSTLKAGLFDAAGRLIGAASSRNEATTPRPGWREQDPAATWRAAVEVSQALYQQVPGVMASVRAVAITGARGSFFVRDADGTARTPIITWQDRRAAGVTLQLAAAARLRRVSTHDGVAPR